VEGAVGGDGHQFGAAGEVQGDVFFGFVQRDEFAQHFVFHFLHIVFAGDGDLSCFDAAAGFQCVGEGVGFCAHPLGDEQDDFARAKGVVQHRDVVGDGLVGDDADVDVVFVHGVFLSGFVDVVTLEGAAHRAHFRRAVFAAASFGFLRQLQGVPLRALGAGGGGGGGGAGCR
jgi:hypothetical protein